MKVILFLFLFLNISTNVLSQYSISLYDGDFKPIKNAQLKVDSVFFPFDSTSSSYLIPLSYIQAKPGNQPNKVVVECNAEGYLPIKGSMYLLNVLYLFRPGEDTLYSTNPMPCRYEKNTLLFPIKDNNGPILFDELFYPCGSGDPGALGVKRNQSPSDVKYYIGSKQAYGCFIFPLNRGVYRAIGNAFSMYIDSNVSDLSKETNYLEEWKRLGVIKEYFIENSSPRLLVVRLFEGDHWKSPTLIKQLSVFSTLSFPNQEVFIQACPD